MDASKLKPLKSRTNKFEHLAEYPETDYDYFQLFDSDAVWNDIYDAVMGKKKASALLKDASFVDEIQRKSKIPQGKKSVTIRLTIGSDEKNADITGDRKRRRTGYEKNSERKWAQSLETQ